MGVAASNHLGVAASNYYYNVPQAPPRFERMGRPRLYNEQPGLFERIYESCGIDGNGKKYLDLSKERELGKKILVEAHGRNLAGNIELTGSILHKRCECELNPGLPSEFFHK